MSKFKYLIIGKKTFLCVGLTVFIAFFGTFCGVGWNKTLTTTANAKKLPVYCVQTDKKQIAISFDAAWGNEDTGELIKILDKYDVKTTFFVVGEWVDKYPESVKQLSDAGHEIMNHSDSHPHMPQLSIEKMTEEINSCNDKIEKITGRRPTLFRAPYGEYSNQLIDVLAAQNMLCIQWDIDSRDWKEDYTTQKIVDGVLNNVKQGDIVLFHNAAKHTPEALPIILEKLISDGYEILPISKLILTNNFTINHEGRQIANTTAKSQLSF
ncbi:MAG: polysaccharide deacetylase family protein [Clostridia bacterium]|nr:polysaccharide deacetylase family protein [Clostridia bacterium]